MRSLKETLKLLSSKNIVPADTEERNSLLRSFGYQCIRDFYQLEKLITMMFIENELLVYPWKISVRYVDPVFKVAHVDVFFEPIKTVVPMWMCIDSIIKAGKAPLFGAHGRQIQDMAFMCEEQEHSMILSMYHDHVIENGEPLFAELSFHIQYVLDIIYGIRGFKGVDENLYYVATDWDLAEKWRNAICIDGKIRMKKAVTSNRYHSFVSELYGLQDNREDKSLVEIAEQLVPKKEVLISLSSKL